MLEALLGIIIGLLLNPTKTKALKGIKEIKKRFSIEETQFIEPVDKSKKWREANSLNDILE